VEIISIEKNSVIFSFQEEGNFINCSDHNEDGTFFATAGQDARMRVYDSENPDKVLHVYSRLANPTHANRIYSLKFYPDNKNLIASGGWDESLILWDIRTPHTANFIYGPLICGDSMDLRNNEILTGSWRQNRQLQIWDIRTLKETAYMEWKLTDFPKEKPFIYSCIFEKKFGKYIIAGSSGVNEIRLYENGRKYECLDIEVGFKKGIYSLDSSKFKNQFCYGSEKCGIYSIY
jgi:WD40 repeat protein